MKWDFTGEQVVKAEVDYSLEEFRGRFLSGGKGQLSGI